MIQDFIAFIHYDEYFRLNNEILHSYVFKVGNIQIFVTKIKLVK